MVLLNCEGVSERLVKLPEGFVNGRLYDVSLVLRLKRGRGSVIKRK